MIEQIIRDNSRELEKRYQGTYGFLQSESGKKLLVSVDSITERYTVVSDDKKNQYQLNSDTGCELEFTQVPCQWFNPCEGVIVYVNRRPERQWKRGICSANTLLSIPRLSGSDFYTAKMNAGKVSQLFYPDPNSKAFDSELKTKCGLWSKYFAWSMDTVYVRDMVIGKVDHELKTIKLDDYELFQQELKDALIRSKSEYKVVNA